MSWLFVILIVLPDGGTMNGHSKVYSSEAECRSELTSTVSKHNGYIEDQFGYFEAKASNDQVFNWKAMCTSMESSPLSDL